MAKKEVHWLKDFSNVDEVFDKMLELGFFVNEAHRDEQKDLLLNPREESPFSQNEYWYSNSVVEVKIFRRIFGGLELCNHRGLKHDAIDQLFTTAMIPIQGQES